MPAQYFYIYSDHTDMMKWIRTWSVTILWKLSVTLFQALINHTILMCMWWGCSRWADWRVDQLVIKQSGPLRCSEGMWWWHSTDWGNADLRFELADIFTAERCLWNNYYISLQSHYRSASTWLTLLVWMFLTMWIYN